MKFKTSYAERMEFLVEFTVKMFDVNVGLGYNTEQEMQDFTGNIDKLIAKHTFVHGLVIGFALGHNEKIYSEIATLDPTGLSKFLDPYEKGESNES